MSGELNSVVDNQLVDPNAKVVAVLSDLMFRVKISDAGKRASRELVFVQSQADVLKAARQKPDLILFDLDCEPAKPVETIAQLKDDPDLAPITLIGYVSHVNAERIAAAQKAGCDRVLARSAFAQQLPEILKGELAIRSKQAD